MISVKWSSRQFINHDFFDDVQKGTEMYGNVRIVLY